MKQRILLFPSAWSTEQVFTPQLELLQNHFEVIFPAIRQFNDIEKMADYVISYYQDVYAMLGLSMGGFVIQNILAKAPRFSKKAILMGTHAYANSAETKVYFQSLIDDIKKGQLETVAELFANVMIAPANLNNLTLKAQIRQLPLDLGAASCINDSTACINYKDHTAALSVIKAKTLIQHGEFDGGVPLAAAETLHQSISGSSLKIIANAGHIITLEQPEQVNQAVMNWLQ